MGRLAAAMSEYEKEHGNLPVGAMYAKQGTPLLSWRVLILPYLERKGRAEAGFFSQFKLDEPWDGPHNAPLLERMPEIFDDPTHESRSSYATKYQLLSGNEAAFKNSGMSGWRINESLRIVVAPDAAPWTKPEDLASSVARTAP